ncbi:ectoine/hydroxyectoine ABC transporter substrate-binding protein EhuB [Nocardia sp. NBC_00508]|uniref:ectoine/hydroxyectoine ABC transporter substrate-binding protein EhuB n=1 Tax=Nocardia sp. NBC_00508 TaxID=2975992 RepID=UPI002E81AB79|nr:ectoine/hydroxyectoine ABC transporter substrate-binding protein EhuB [Nocardia sp. NBC_00508]WUD63766.1 ectoine/hydroxyectoine ABC transporter substrate-binding protein EhuB [Nocardia sp. NBC_00508]
MGGDGAAAVTYAEAKSSGKIKVGFANEAPWAFLDEKGELTGYAPTVARAVLKKLGINEVEGVVTDFDGLIDGVRAKNYAFVAAGMFINPKRCESSDFAIPDYRVGSAFLVPKGNPRDITRFEDITRANVRIATLGGAVENGYAESSGVPSNLIEPMAKQDDILRAVRNNDVYGGAMLDVTASWLVKNNPDANLEVTSSFQFSAKPDVGTFNFRLDDDQFREDFNRELRALHESGEWLKLVEPFGLTAANEPDPSRTTEQYCTA